MGRFTMAAKHHQSIAEIYESDAVDLERAVHHYEQAADYFRGEESNSSANKCLLKVAQYAAQLENYDKAIQIYEQVKEITIHADDELPDSFANLSLDNKFQMFVLSPSV